MADDPRERVKGYCATNTSHHAGSGNEYTADGIRKTFNPSKIKSSGSNP